MVQDERAPTYRRDIRDREVAAGGYLTVDTFVIGAKKVVPRKFGGTLPSEPTERGGSFSGGVQYENIRS